MSELPLYQCHKRVRATKVKSFTRQPDSCGGMHDPYIVTLELDGHPSVQVMEDQLRGLSVGGYYIVYEDGYESFSPARAFEDGYTLVSVLEAEEEYAARESAYVTDEG